MKLRIQTDENGKISALTDAATGKELDLLISSIDIKIHPDQGYRPQVTLHLSPAQLLELDLEVDPGQTQLVLDVDETVKLIQDNRKKRRDDGGFPFGDPPGKERADES
jgi:hypothetical protein